MTCKPEHQETTDQPVLEWRREGDKLVAELNGRKIIADIPDERVRQILAEFQLQRGYERIREVLREMEEGGRAERPNASTLLAVTSGPPLTEEEDEREDAA